MKVCDEGVRNLACGVCAKAVEDYVRLKSGSAKQNMLNRMSCSAIGR